MAIFCCCPQLRHRKKPEGEDGTCDYQHPEGLPTCPPPAKLPPPACNGANLSPQSTAARSSLSNLLPGAVADDSVHLAELIIDDSEDDNGDGALFHTSRNRSTSTLKAVKARIRRHLSQDSVYQSETEEQIARRAEVKRLMRIRIQKELQTESPRTRSGPRTPQYPAPSSVASATLPGNGPRDTIEFAVDQVKETQLVRAKAAHLSKSLDDDDRRVSRALSNRLSAQSFGKENRQPHSRPISPCERIEIERDLKSTPADHQRHVRQRSSLWGVSVSPQLQPIRVASFHDAGSLGSLRLALSAEKLADLLTPDKTQSLFRPVTSSTASCDTLNAKPRSREHFKRTRSSSSPLAALSANAAKMNRSQVSLHSSCRRRGIPQSSSLVRDESPVGLWLRAQSHHFRLSTTSPVHSDIGTDGEGVGRAQDASADQPPSAVAYALPRRSISEPTERQMALASHPAGYVGLGTIHLLATEKDHINSSFREESPALVHMSAKTAAAEKPPTEDFRTAVPGVVRRGFAGIRLPSFRWRHSSNKCPDEHKATPPSEPCRDNQTPSLVYTHTRHTTLEAGSDTSSFFRREAELRTVEERFRDSHLRKEPLTPVESKFHEVLSDNPRFAARNLLLSRLELSPPMDGELFVDSFDGKGPEPALPACPVTGARQGDHLSTPCQGHLRVPSTEHSKLKITSKRSRFSNYSDGSPRSRGFSSSRDGDETAEMWKRALRAESVSKSPRRSISSQMVAPQVVLTEVQDGTPCPRAPCSTEIDGRSGFGSHDHSPSCTGLPTQDEEESFRQSLVKSNTLLQDWSRQLESQRDAKPKTDLASVPRSTYQISKAPPASWAKFPSHSREERNGAAGERDNVKPRDFAVKQVSASGSITWTTDKADDGGPSHRNIVRSVSDKFTQPFKSRWSKLAPGRAGVPYKDRSIRAARRSSLQGSGVLEYPELELLPTAGGYRELLALEREINEMKGCAGSNTGSYSNQTAATDNRRSLIEKMAGALQNDGSADANLPTPANRVIHVDGYLARKRLPVTPAQTRPLTSTHTKDMTGSSGERYVTPLTHFSISRSTTPHSMSYFPATAHTPGSVHSTASVIRHKSMCVPDNKSGVSISIAEADLYNDRSSTRRRSAPPVTAEFD